MSEQEENELICAKLLGWKDPASFGTAGIVWNTDSGLRGTPSFTTWADAGLILDWLNGHVGPGLEQVRDELGFGLKHRNLTPAAIRAAALAYLGAQK